MTAENIDPTLITNLSLYESSSENIITRNLHPAQATVNVLHRSLRKDVVFLGKTKAVYGRDTCCCLSHTGQSIKYNPSSEPFLLGHLADSKQIVIYEDSIWYNQCLNNRCISEISYTCQKFLSSCLIRICKRYDKIMNVTLTTGNVPTLYKAFLENSWLSSFKTDSCLVLPAKPFVSKVKCFYLSCFIRNFVFFIFSLVCLVSPFVLLYYKIGIYIQQVLLRLTCIHAKIFTLKLLFKNICYKLMIIIDSEMNKR